MTSVRSCPAIVSTSNEYFIVIGGYEDGGWKSTVELFHVRDRLWFTLTDLPQPLTYPSATIYGDLVHVIGNRTTGYMCSIQCQPPNYQPITTLSWELLPPLPVTQSTVATLCGKPVLIGGKQDESAVNSIHKLEIGKWVEIGSLLSKRSWCLIVHPSDTRIIVVGGRYRYDEVCDVAECVVVG